MKGLADFQKTKDLLLCIDSDGTAIDSMTSKHKYCFGPAFVETWGLEGCREQALNDWNTINLHGKTRGKNRFITLLMILEQYSGTLVHDDLTDLKRWVNGAEKLSGGALEEEIARTDSTILKKALAFSNAVNTKIAALKEKNAFAGVREFLEFAKTQADIAVVSSADTSALYHEWEQFGLLGHVSVVTAQEDGTKAECIAKLKRYGYAPENILMIGDAPPDLEAAESCGVCFYPILPERESESWNKLHHIYFGTFSEGCYKDVQESLIAAFLNG